MDKIEEIEENIDKVSRDGDFLPRKFIESGGKRSKSCQPSLSLQVKTRSSNERPHVFINDWENHILEH